MTVFDFDDRSLLGTRAFQPDEEDLKGFEYLLANSEPMPAKILVDMIEEDFRRETIPHVNVLDRQSLINRMLDRHYRDEVYVHAERIGRASEGRKDDRLLLSALTNSGLMAPWLERLEKFGVKLAGIWSLPLLTEKVVKSLLQDEEHVLIVSRQVRSALRFSYFSKGKLLLSRQAKFDRDMWDNEDFAGVIANLERGTEEIYNFLLNQRMLKASEKLQVFFILQDDNLEEARSIIREQERVQFTFVGLQQLFKQVGLQNSENLGADALFSYQCYRASPLVDHYATVEQKAPYYRYLVDKFIGQVTELGSLACITLAVVFALKSMELDHLQVLIEQNNLQLRQSYERAYGDLQAQLDDATGIQSTVRLLDKIKLDADQNLTSYFDPVGTVLNEPRYRSVILKELSWKKYPVEELKLLVQSHRLALGENVDDMTPEESDFPADGWPKQAVLTLFGSIKTDGYSYRATKQVVDNLIADLRALPEVETVLLLRTAVDVRSSSQFSDRVGNEDFAATNIDTNAFEIFIVLEQPHAGA